MRSSGRASARTAAPSPASGSAPRATRSRAALPRSCSASSPRTSSSCREREDGTHCVRRGIPPREGRATRAYRRERGGAEARCFSSRTVVPPHPGGRCRARLRPPLAGRDHETGHLMLVLTEDEAMLRDSARGFLAEAAPVSQLRALRDSRDETGFSRELWGSIAE